MELNRGITSGGGANRPLRSAARLGGAPRALLLEAHARLLRAASAAFEEAGVEVCARTKISDAEEALRTQHFDFLVLGMIVEELFADEVLASLLSRGVPQPLPPVVVVSHLSEEATWECLPPCAPIRGVLAKPLHAEKVAAWAEKLLDGRMMDEDEPKSRKSPAMPEDSNMFWTALENCGQGQAGLRLVNQFA